MRRSWLILAIIVLLLAGCQSTTNSKGVGAEVASQTPLASTEELATAYPAPAEEPTATATQVSTAEEAAYPAAETATEDATATPSESAGTSETYPSAGSGDSTAISLWAADGEIADGEYTHQTTIGPITLYWMNDATDLYMGLEATSEGWIAVGLNPQRGMQGADFVIAYMEGDMLQVGDAYGQGVTGPTHPLDTDLGGTSDVGMRAALRDQGRICLEFRKALDTGDQYDSVLKSGETYPVIVALGSGTGFASSHSYRGSGEITLD